MSDDCTLLPAQKFGAKAATHKSSPFSWVNKDQFIGGCDDTLAYVKDSYYGGPKKQALTAQIPAVEEGAYDYDVVVIGGGSGGLACSKELAIQGLKVGSVRTAQPPLGDNMFPACPSGNKNAIQRGAQ
jgi:hypothetical protein